MKRLLPLFFCILQLLVLPVLRAEMPIDDAQLTGTANQVKTGATLTVQSGATLAVATDGTATAPAWFLNTFTASTINTGQNGLGWDENGRVTLQTPVGALQFYETGSPLESVIYWPGRIITGTMDAGVLTGNLSATRINAPTGFEAIDFNIVSRSLVPPLDKWQMGQTYAGAAGITYVLDTDYHPGMNEYEPTVGVYFPQANVTAGGTTAINQVAGRYRTATQVKSDLAIAATDLTATGTKDSTTYLRGDNTWAVVSGGAVTNANVNAAIASDPYATRIELELGSAATLNVGTASGSVADGAAPYAAQVAAMAASQPLNTLLTNIAESDGSGTPYLAELSLVGGIYGDSGWQIGSTGIFTGTMSAANLSTGTVATARLPAQTTASVRTVSANATILSTNAVVICTGAGGITLTLPAANANTPRVTQLEIINRTSGTVTLVRAGSDLFEGDTSALISTGASWSITSDASANWYLY